MLLSGNEITGLNKRNCLMRVHEKHSRQLHGSFDAVSESIESDSAPIPDTI